MATGATYWRTGEANFTLAAILAAMAALFVGVRFYFILKPEVARLTAEYREHRETLFNEGCGEVAETMSHLSAADFSVFVTCHRMMRESEQPHRFMTSRGSPVHYVLVQMTDVRCARPLEMKRIRPGHDASLCQYELTDVGIALLPTMLRDASNRRNRRTRAA